MEIQRNTVGCYNNKRQISKKIDISYHKIPKPRRKTKKILGDVVVDYICKQKSIMNRDARS